ncbi:MAG TPA: FlgD immunoglobulin-like domain containing protein, partial [bacterium]
SQFIDLQTGTPVNPIPFAGLGTAAVQVTAPGLVTQSITLYAGWNIFSLAVTPEGDQDLLKILTPMLPVLVKVIDEEGRSIVKLFGNWVNSIGNWQATEGYHINVSQNVTLQVTGMEIKTPMPIPLKAGWNIMSYPCLSVSRDAKSVLQSLIDSNYLVKVINEQGQSLVKIFGNWNNSIGNMNPGEGYLINVNTSCTLTMSCSGSPSISAGFAKPIEPQHFRFDKTGNPFEPMNIFVVDARINGQPLTMGDEIAVYDGDQLVGVSVLNSTVSIANPLELIASKDDGNGKGFLDGHAMRYKIWRSSTSETFPIDDAQVQFFDPNNGDLIEAHPFEAYGTAVTAINFMTTSVAEQQMIPQSYALHQNYPNPFNPTTRISYELPEATDVDVVIFDLQGNLVKRLFNGRQNAGRYEMEWDGRNNQGIRVVSGIYFYRLNTAKFTATHKMILAK